MTSAQLQARASGLVRKAIRNGVLVRQPCEVCGSEPSDAHHDDYEKPLDVRWLCRLHHRWVSAYGDTVESMRAELTTAKAYAERAQP